MIRVRTGTCFLSQTLGVQFNHMDRCVRLFAISLVLLGPTSLPGWTGNDPWVNVQSAHFNVITDGGETRGRDLALQLEQLHSAFSQIVPPASAGPPIPLDVIALKNSSEIGAYSRLYRGRPIRSTGFCIRSEDRDYIVLNLESLNREHLIHEYAHLLIAPDTSEMPAWFNEGAAELYSTIQIDKNHATVGRPPDSVREVLHTQNLMPILSLFGVDQDSPVYNEEGLARSTFYADSWLVVHYLWERQEMEQVWAYIQLVRSKLPVAEAIQQAFHMDAAQFDARLQSYARSAVLTHRVVIHPETVATDVAVRPMSLLEAQTALAGLHAHLPEYEEQAIGELQDILQQDPENISAHRDLGYLYHRRHDSDEALPHLQAAAEKSPNDWRVHFLWAQISAQLYLDKLAPQIEREARRAVELNPGFAPGYGVLGYALMVEHKNADAISAYRQALSLKPDNETYQLNLAELYSLQGRLEEAKALFLSLQNSSDLTIAIAAHSHLEYMATPKPKLP